jgi:murein DD-endopeptidase MepM/ murein hydrolase activator NlpD
MPGLCLKMRIAKLATLVLLFLPPLTGDAGIDAELALLYARPHPVVVATPVVPQTPRAAVQVTEVAPVAAPTQFVRPVPGAQSGWGFIPGRHEAVDLWCNEGVTPVRSMAAGFIVHSDWTDDGCGYNVIVDHGGGLTSRYCHLQPPLATGRVMRGGWLGTCGASGWSGGQHLHWEVRKNGAAVNPLEEILW